MTSPSDVPCWVVVDCSTGRTTSTPLTTAEQQAKQNSDAATAAAIARAQAARQQLVSAVQQKAAQDPAFAALAQLLGVI